MRVPRADKAVNRRYLELGCRGDSASPTLTWTITPNHAADWAEWRSFSRAPLMWTGRPPRSRKNNYKSCFDNNNAAGVDFDRIIALGFCEGPLHYLLWIVNPIACIIKTVVPSYKPGDALGKIDLTNAIFCRPTASSDCDYQGFLHPVTKEYYRYRYVPFGNRQTPAVHKRRWAHVIRDILLKEGLQFCVPGSPEASYANFDVASIYFDYFLLKFNSSSSSWHHDLTPLSCVNTLHKYGLPVKLAKNEWPSTRCEFVGVIDTVRGTVAVSAARCNSSEHAIASLASLHSANPTEGSDPAEPCVVDHAPRADLLGWRDTLAAGASCLDPSPADPIQPLERSYRRVPSFPSL
eukprot:jgi/Tetstr1/426758/TSEL_001695.t1